tara:strand:+ start:11462 stop:11689 length:228 start_codon:yes stop_codon:yes gene_type:complete
LLKKIVRLALCDLLSASKKTRKEAYQYILHAQFKDDCDKLELPYNYILRTVSVSIELKKAQKRAIIKELLVQLGV